MKTVLPAECARGLDLAVVGDEVELKVSAVNGDGSVEVETMSDAPLATPKSVMDLPSLSGAAPTPYA